MTSAMTPERWQAIKHLVNSALQADSQARTALLQQSCADDFALRIGAEALLSQTRKLPDAPLTPHHWQHIEQVFQAALELAADKRAAFLSQACAGNDVLRHEVESLLVYQGAAGGLIQGLVHEAVGLLPHHEPARFTPGTTLNKRYRILGLLGKGGMGEVYRADDLRLGQPVALKFLSEKLSQDKAMLARFHSEVSMAHRVTHPNVCRVHDIGEVITSAGAWQFLSMEYVDGEDLSSLLRRIGRLPSDKAVEIANQLCAGLAAAHDAGVLHRDLKPANVMIDGKGRVRITDFGLAGFAEQIKGSEVLAGTPAYMSPEQFAGKEVTTKSDIYALGLVLYEVFTGKRVFEAGSLDELRRMHESSAPTNPSSWVKDLDPLVERVILRCLEKDPSRRLASAKQVADALPGGDPLAAALALGETPSPEMVAAAGSKTGMKPIYAVLCLLAIIAGLIAEAAMSRRLSLVERAGLRDSPEVMSGKARAIFAQLGYADSPTDRAYGLRYDNEYLSHIEKNVQAPDRERLIATGQTPAINFWYRESPMPLSATLRWDIRSVTADDPPENIPGMRSLSLDPSGRLLRFGVVPPRVEKNSAPGVAPNWEVPFALAGLDITQFTATEPEWLPDPLGACDAQAAWTGPDPLHPETRLRIEAGGYHGKLVSFQILWPYQLIQRGPSLPTSGQVATNVVELVLFFSFVFGAVWLIRRNMKAGRADLRGALRLALVVLISGLLGQLLLSPYHLIFTVTNVRVWVSLKIGVALFSAVIAGGFYLALEPFIRRKWPHIVISWNRLLAGAVRDPLVGRDLLAGMVLGILINLCFGVIALTRLSLGFVNVKREVLSALVGARGLSFQILNDLPGAVVFLLGVCFMVFLLRLALKRDWLACVALVTFVAFYSSMTSTWLGVSTSILSASLMMIALTRFGFLGLVGYYLGLFLVGFALITTNLSAWYASSGLFVAGLVLVLAGYAFHTSLGGQKVFSGKLLEE